MPDTKEQRLDIIKNCKLLLEGCLKEHRQTDNTAQGRMITQCKWLKERAENHDLSLPINRGKLGSLLYTYTNGEITNLAGDPDDKKSVHEDVETFMDRLIALVRDGELLIKSEYYPYTIRYIDALIKLLATSSRPLDKYEQGLIPELNQLKQLLSEGKIEPPLMSYLPEYPNFRKVYRLYERTIDDIKNGKYLIECTTDMLFEGIRPDSWLTLEDADLETQKL